jgi:hypothetical protein
LIRRGMILTYPAGPGNVSADSIEERKKGRKEERIYVGFT